MSSEKEIMRNNYTLTMVLVNLMDTY